MSDLSKVRRSDVSRIRWDMLIRRPGFVASLTLFLAIGIVWAVVAAHSTPPSLDQRVYAVASQLQCPVCHNGESAAASSSDQAAQMRALIREQLQHGMSEQQIVQYFHAHYGDAILESPPKQGFSALIWIAPLLMLLVGTGIVVSAAREWRRPAPGMVAAPKDLEDEECVAEGDLSPEERARLADVLRRELARDEGFAIDAGMEGI
jgi:cytochrome c-type biogenesis protein CcmH